MPFSPPPTHTLALRPFHMQCVRALLASRVKAATDKGKVSVPIKLAWAKPDQTSAEGLTALDVAQAMRACPGLQPHAAHQSHVATHRGAHCARSTHRTTPLFSECVCVGVHCQAHTRARTAWPNVLPYSSLHPKPIFSSISSSISTLCPQFRGMLGNRVLVFVCPACIDASQRRLART